MNQTQAVQDEFWVLRQLLVSENALTPEVRQHTERMRHRFVGMVRTLEKQIESLEDELDDLESRGNRLPVDLPPQPWTHK